MERKKLMKLIEDKKLKEKSINELALLFLIDREKVELVINNELLLDLVYKLLKYNVSVYNIRLAVDIACGITNQNDLSKFCIFATNLDLIFSGHYNYVVKKINEIKNIKILGKTIEYALNEKNMNTVVYKNVLELATKVEDSDDFDTIISLAKMNENNLEHFLYTIDKLDLIKNMPPKVFFDFLDLFIGVDEKTKNRIFKGCVDKVYQIKDCVILNKLKTLIHNEQVVNLENFDEILQMLSIDDSRLFESQFKLVTNNKLINLPNFKNIINLVSTINNVSHLSNYVLFAELENVIKLEYYDYILMLAARLENFWLSSVCICWAKYSSLDGLKNIEYALDVQNQIENEKLFKYKCLVYELANSIYAIQNYDEFKNIISTVVKIKDTNDFANFVELILKYKGMTGGVKNDLNYFNNIIDNYELLLVLIKIIKVLKADELYDKIIRVLTLYDKTKVRGSIDDINIKLNEYVADISVKLNEYIELNKMTDSKEQEKRKKLTSGTN